MEAPQRLTSSLPASQGPAPSPGRLIALVGVAGSGKDTVASVLSTEHNALVQSFSTALRKFCAEIFPLTPGLLDGPSVNRGARVLPLHPSLPGGLCFSDQARLEQAMRDYTLSTFYTHARLRALRADLGIFSHLGLSRADLYERIEALALMLTAVGSDLTVRQLLRITGAWGRTIDPMLWIRPVIAVVDSALAQGRLVVVTDPRHANEHDALVDRGASFWWLEPGERVARIEHPTEPVRAEWPDATTEISTEGPKSALPALVAAALGAALEGPHKSLSIDP